MGEKVEKQKKKLKAAIISMGSVSSKMTAEAMRNYFVEVDELNVKHIDINFDGRQSIVMCDGKPLKKYDCIYPKGAYYHGPLLRSITSILQEKTYFPIHPTAFSIVHDKLLTQLVLERHKIPMPRTYLSATTHAAKNILQKMTYPIIMKFPQGTQGKGVMIADSFASASSFLDALTALRQPFIIQEYIETGNSDIRVIVVGDKVAAAMVRKGRPDEKRANIHAGGIGEAYEPDELTKKIVISTAKAIKADICGVDVLKSVLGPRVIEANISPGLQGITAATGLDIADKIAKYLHKEATKFSLKREGEKGSELLREMEAENGKKLSLITNADMRGTRLLLPEAVTNATRFTEVDNLQMEAKDGELKVKRLKIDGNSNEN
ncbi:RimK family alpha-L-glutamate ligase [Candidatus Woesearchaeota archaeon]|nr:RimK family alpha-L-glutamate ligase [Candidatus Woesearchaeota archaeon]